MPTDIAAIDQKFLKKIKNIMQIRLQFFWIFGIVYKRSNGSLAQLGEHLPYKQGVIGSSPITSTNNLIYKYSAEWNAGMAQG